MCKLFIILAILLLAGNAWALYLSDANIVGAWLMVSDGGSEPDATTNAETLTELGGTIPTSATVPAGLSGTSRDFERSEGEALYVGDGGTTDISGADQALSVVAWIKFEADPGDDAAIVDKSSNSGDQRQYRFFS